MDYKITVSSDAEADKQELCRVLLIELNRLCAGTGGCSQSFNNNRPVGLTVA